MPLGVVETKNARYLIKNSIIQCMKQLLALHKKEQEVKKRNGPLFGVVTDALHFIFIKLTKDKQFQFEKEDHGETSQSSETIIDEIKVHTANTWKDLDNIAAIINGLCQQRIKKTLLILMFRQERKSGQMLVFLKNTSENFMNSPGRKITDA